MRGDVQTGIEALNKNLPAYEAELHGTFFGGSKPAMVDYMIWPMMENIPKLSEAGFVFNADGKLPKLAAWFKAMEADEAVKKTKVPDDIMTKFMESMKEGKPNYDIE
jgi:glutathione S-transferase